jgi:hypothetical protein
VHRYPALFGVLTLASLLSVPALAGSLPSYGVLCVARTLPQARQLPAVCVPDPR